MRHRVNIDIHDKSIIAKGLEAITEFYHTIAIDEKRFNHAQAFVTGADSPFLNVLFDLRAIRENSGDLANEAIIYFKKHNVPWGWFLFPSSSQIDLTALGFILIDEVPAMYFNLSDEILNTELTSLRIIECKQNDALQEWIQPINEGFEIKEGDDIYRKLNAKLLNEGVNKLKHFVAYYNDNVAAAATLFMSNDSVMIHNLATKSIFKNKGLGTYLTLSLMARAKEMGFQHCYLDSSEAAFNLYKRIGFKVYETTQVYTKP